MSSRFIWKQVVYSLIAILLSACAGGGDGGGNPAGAVNPSQNALQAEIDNLFPYTLANQLFDITFVCQRANSSLTYYFDFHTDGTYDIYATLNTGQDIAVTGTYTFQNNEIHMQSSNSFLPMDERTTTITTAMGLIASFNTNTMQCTIYGHGYNDAAVERHRHYKCPFINVGAGSREENAIEFTLPTGLPFNQSVNGAVFRQKDVYVNGLTNPVITQGYGIYRRIGDTFYAAFGNQFSDVNLLKGQFLNGELQLSVDQLEPSAGQCMLQ